MSLPSTIQQIDALKKEADALQPVNPEFEQKFWNKYRLEFNYNSNHIEGNTLTYGHTQLLLMFDKVGSDSYSLRELEEMKAHDAALKLVKEAALEPNHVLTEKFIKEINQIILVRPYYKEAETFDGQPTRRLIEPGQYKKFPNNVRLENGEIFHYASVEETPAQMGDLIDWIRKEEESKELHPVQLAALVHYRFVRIHPFDDSNGRTSRLLMNYYLMRYGYAPVVIESSDKKNYLAALNRADTGDMDFFINYVSIQSLRWQQFYSKAARGESIEEDQDIFKEIELLKNKIDYSNYTAKTFSSEALNKIYFDTLLPFLTKVFDKFSTLDNHFLRKD
jgi:Fic family protein